MRGQNVDFARNVAVLGHVQRGAAMDLRSASLRLGRESSGQPCEAV